MVTISRTTASHYLRDGIEESEVKKGGFAAPVFRSVNRRCENNEAGADRLVNEEILGIVDFEAFVLDSGICQSFCFPGDIGFVVHGI